MWGQPRGSSSLLFGTNRWIKSLASISRSVSSTVSSRKMPQGTVMVHQTLRNNGFHPKKNHQRRQNHLPRPGQNQGLPCKIGNFERRSNARSGSQKQEVELRSTRLTCNMKNEQHTLGELLIDISPRSCRIKKILWGKPSSSTGGKPGAWDHG